MKAPNVETAIADRKTKSKISAGKQERRNAERRSFKLKKSTSELLRTETTIRKIAKVDRPMWYGGHDMHSTAQTKLIAKVLDQELQYQNKLCSNHTSVVWRQSC